MPGDVNPVRVFPYMYPYSPSGGARCQRAKLHDIKVCYGHRRQLFQPHKVSNLRAVGTHNRILDCVHLGRDCSCGVEHWECLMEH